ncbi:MAG: hypothetical protein HC817_08790 [Saprospiraceae bacterium]|nr:hypothetical protein [Saprospiraceae bacterium]
MMKMKTTISFCAVVCCSFWLLPTADAQLLVAQNTRQEIKTPVMRLLSEVLNDLKTHYKVDILFESKVISGVRVNRNALNFP